MPFKSKAQMRWMIANMPYKAKEFLAHTPNIKDLPEYARIRPDKIKLKVKK